jgi:hypothetical protein
VRADVDDAPAVHDGDPVGVVRGVQPVRDRRHRPPRQDRRERALEVPRSTRVEQARRLVENESVRVEEHEPGERELLRLHGSPSGRSTSGTSPTVTAAPLGGWMPASMRPSVDLPAPDGPTMASRSPTTMPMPMPCSTSCPSR